MSCSRSTARPARLRASLTGLVLLAGSAGLLLAPSASAATGGCTETGYMQDKINLTAAVIATTSPVTGNVDAATCDIGVYVSGITGTGSVTGATISGAPRYYGILVNDAAVDTSDSTVIGVGDSPHDGSQHGVGISYQLGATGNITNNTVTDYQKNGIVVRDTGSSASVTGNTVTGDGTVDYIAQNGIQISFGASGTVTGNSISGNDYTGANTACGLLMYQSDGVKTGKNSFSDNQKNVCTVGRGGGNVSAG